MSRETPIRFSCRGDSLVGIVHHGATAARRGILIVVGGPQYRAGSHRQFVLLARRFAEAGIPAMRFDYRGMGDSDGTYLGFEHLDDDIAAAIDAFRAACPGVNEIVLWGLCDAASAILFYANRDPRIAGIVLLNPWVRTVAGEAKAYLKHYYAGRLLDGAFWRKLLAGHIDLRASLRSLIGMVGQARRRSGDVALTQTQADSGSLPDRMAEGLRRYRGPVLLLISGKDLTAREFEDAAASSTAWTALLAEPRVTRFEMKEADHTFSRVEWRDMVARWTLTWLEASAPR